MSWHVANAYKARHVDRGGPAKKAGAKSATLCGSCGHVLGSLQCRKAHK